MKPSLQKLRALCPGIGEEFVRDHLARLGNEYFERFDLDQIAAHVGRLARLSPEHPAEVLLSQRWDGTVDCTLLAFDYPFEFSLITGVCSGLGYSVLSGDVFTYERAVPWAGGRPRSRGAAAAASAARVFRRRRNIDQFSGTCTVAVPFGAWSRELRIRLLEIIPLLEQGDDDALEAAKRRVNEWVTERLAAAPARQRQVLYPVQLKIENDTPRFTRLKVVSQDTPAFLYSLSTAVSLHGFSIEAVRIRTVHGRIEDEIDVADLAGRPVTDADKLNHLKFSVLFTKQFTHFLDQAPDPYAALSRFEQLMRDIAPLPQSRQWRELLSNPKALQDMARILGASDFMWEDFIRLQYEELLPILRPYLAGQGLAEPAATLPARLRETVAAAADFEGQKRALNEFKDREIFLIDLDHILRGTADFDILAERLTLLAEAVVRAAADAVYAALAARHGRPRTVAGLETPFALMGLGKFGGAALGYASDIELLVAYGDSGFTDGRERIGNDEFFGALAGQTAQFIEAKREGIFHVDLRLRPHGNSGPLACSVESFCRYYGPGGPAHSVERLALVRLRAVGGDAALGAQIERLRDEFIYASASVRFEDVRRLREKQFAEKNRGGTYNAKFSPGALVDLEYAVQMLQVLHAHDVPGLRTPRLHEALAGLRAAGVLAADECGRLTAAYDFLRRLVNGLRMLRGSARDLFLPPVESDEFVHLARRMGYAPGDALKPAQQLHLDFEVHTAAVRAFVQRYFGRASLPGPPTGNVADLLLSDAAPEALRSRVLAAAGFRDVKRAYVNLRKLAGDGPRRDLFAKLAILAGDMLRREPDADMALNNWERFIGALEAPERHFADLLSQPRRLTILLGILSRSQFLADTLIRSPDFLDWATSPANVQQPRGRDVLDGELRALSRETAGEREWLNALRRFRRREILRIGTRDLCLGVSPREIMSDLSVLAVALIQAALERVWARRPADQRWADSFCVLAFGKLGGGELNYSSDVDLLGVYERAGDGGAEQDETCAQVMEGLHADLARHTEEGYAYRVDLRLRPYGGSGAIVHSAEALERYYRDQASLWEVQALLKLRPIAGNNAVGGRLLGRLEPILRQPRSAGDVVVAIRRLREQTLKQQSRRLVPVKDVKSGLGGLRDVEFLAQGLQLMHAAGHAELLTGNTLEALERLQEAGVLPERVAGPLAEDYIFMRRVEHCLQILEDRQIHTLPQDPAELTALARRMMGIDATAEAFLGEVEERTRRIHKAYQQHLKG